MGFFRKKSDFAPSGRNGLPSHEIHEERAKYSRQARAQIDPANAFDLMYGNKVYYGKVDLEERPVIIQEERLKSFRDESGLLAANFVVDAYEAFYTHINTALSRGKLSANSFLMNIKPRKAYTSPIDAYRTLIDMVMNQYVGGYLVASLNQGLVNSYADFVKEFVRFSDIALRRGVLTLTRYMKSRFCSNLCSGLIVEIHEGRYDDDFEKFSIFLNDENFDFYQDAARKFGFRIDYNVPWRLIADVKSREMRKYMEPYGITSTRQLFTKYYSQTVELEADYYNSLFEGRYNQYIRDFPTYRVPKIVLSKKTGIRELIKCEYKNNPIREKERWKPYDTLYYYTIFRMAEEKIPKNERYLRKKAENAKNIEKRLDMARAMKYINDEVFKSSRG